MIINSDKIPPNVVGCPSLLFSTLNVNCFVKRSIEFKLFILYIIGLNITYDIINNKFILQTQFI